jgi:hypothetical protein
MENSPVADGMRRHSTVIAPSARNSMTYAANAMGTAHTDLETAKNKGAVKATIPGVFTSSLSSASGSVIFVTHSAI